jgi:hypothetical protein
MLILSLSLLLVSPEYRLTQELRSQPAVIVCQHANILVPPQVLRTLRVTRVWRSAGATESPYRIHFGTYWPYNLWLMDEYAITSDDASPYEPVALCVSPEFMVACRTMVALVEIGP